MEDKNPVFQDMWNPVIWLGIPWGGFIILPPVGCRKFAARLPPLTGRYDETLCASNLSMTSNLCCHLITWAGENYLRSTYHRSVKLQWGRQKAYHSLKYFSGLALSTSINTFSTFHHSSSHRQGIYGVADSTRDQCAQEISHTASAEWRRK